MAGIECKMIGTQRLSNKISKMKKDMKDRPQQIMYANLLEIHDAMVSDVAVDTGALKSSIKLIPAGKSAWTIEADQDYAAYVEFGTGTGVKVDGRRPTLVAYALTFLGKGIRERNHPADPFFFGNWFRGKNRMQKELVAFLHKTVHQ
jgi:hypothetical protein